VTELAKVPAQPVGIDVTSDGTLVVSSRAGATLSRIASGSGQVLEPGDLEGEGQQVNVDPDDFAWVTVSQGEDAPGQVLRVDDGGTVADTFEVGSDPGGVAGGEQNEWIVNLGSNSVTRIGLQEFDVEEILLEGAEAPARASEGTAETDAQGIWVSNSGSGTVSRITQFGDVVSTVAGVGEEPRGIVATETDVWVADQAGNALYRITPATPANAIVSGDEAGTAEGPIDLTGEGCEEPRSVDDGFDSIWVTCATGQLVRVDAGSGKVEGSVDVGPDPEGVVVFDDEKVGGIWVTSSGPDAEQDEGFVYEVDPTAVG
jgi:streptogramin lyase